MSALSLEVVVRKIMQPPLRVLSVLTRFRITGRGTSVSTTELSLTNAAPAKTVATAGKELLIGTDKPITVVLTLTDSSTRNLTVNSLLVVTQDYSSFTLAYNDAGQPGTAYARVTVVQS